MLTVEELQKLADSIAAGTVVAIDNTHVSLTRGRVTCSFPHGDLEKPAVAMAVREQTKNLIIETTRAPMTEAQHAAWRAAELAKAAESLRSEAAVEHAARVAALQPSDRRKHDYFAAHGEYDYAEHTAEHGDPIALLDIGVKAGLLADDGERDRLVAWRDRCAGRRGTP